MSITEMKNWLVFIQDAPESIRDYLVSLFWLFVVLVLVGLILKLVFNKQFKELYEILNNTSKLAVEVGKEVLKGAASSLNLPEPYPRVARFFAVIFMINSYLMSITLGCYSLFVAVFTVLSKTTSFWVRNGGMLFFMLLAFLALFCFAEAERDRVRLFKRSSSGGD